MENPTNIQYEVHDFIRGRWSPLAFSNRTVEREKLLTLLEAARWAPSSYNQQPWNFIVATKDHPAEYERMLSCVFHENKRWAQNAPVLILSVAKLYFDPPNPLNPDDTIENLMRLVANLHTKRGGEGNPHAFHDVGMAVANLTIQAIALNLFVHQIAGFYSDKAKSLFHIPQGYEPVCIMAIGYLGDSQKLPEDLRLRELEPRIRKPLEEFVFIERWGHSSPVFTSHIKSG
ncbi:nitroreductase [Fischerella thermalis CCMEE 5282]|nr:nitroreductase [Fischerella thermalis CCMEE 5282]